MARWAIVVLMLPLAALCAWLIARRLPPDAARSASTLPQQVPAVRAQPLPGHSLAAAVVDAHPQPITEDPAPAPLAPHRRDAGSADAPSAPDSDETGDNGDPGRPASPASHAVEPTAPNTTDSDDAPVAQSTPSEPASPPAGDAADGVDDPKPAGGDEPLDDVPPATADAPAVRDAWLLRIRALDDAGDVAGARASLQAFVQRYPDYALPDDLRALMQ